MFEPGVFTRLLAGRALLKTVVQPREQLVTVDLPWHTRQKLYLNRCQIVYNLIDIAFNDMV